jgi:signal transduction histidine kinase
MATAYRQPALMRILILNGLVPIAVIVVLAGTVGWQAVRTKAQMDWVAHSVEVEREIGEAAQLINRMDAGIQNYLSTGRVSSKEPFLATRRGAEDQIARLQGLVADNATSAALVSDLAGALGIWDDHAEAGLKPMPAPARLVVLAESTALMGRVRDRMQAIRAHENRIFADRQVALQFESGILSVAAALAIILGGGFFALFSMRQYRTLNEVFQRNTQTLASQQEELNALNEELNALNEELNRENETLEALVSERTVELVQARDDAEEANRAKSMFLANMSHELRTPLNAIIGYAEILEEEAAELSPEAIGEDVRKIQTAGKHLLALINDILDLSKIEAGKMEVQLEAVPLNPLLGEVATTVQGQAAKNGNRLEVSASAPGLTVVADALRLNQCLLNLLGNACKFTQNGVVTLSVEGDGDWVNIRVRDTGIGMTPAHQAKLFQEFSQVDDTTTRRFGGTGLGLALTRRFCDMMGGSIGVESAIGEGSTFTIRLPAASGVPVEA